MRTPEDITFRKASVGSWSRGTYPGFMRVEVLITLYLPFRIADEKSKHSELSVIIRLGQTDAGRSTVELRQYEADSSHDNQIPLHGANVTGMSLDEEMEMFTWSHFIFQNHGIATNMVTR